MFDFFIFLIIVFTTVFIALVSGSKKTGGRFPVRSRSPIVERSHAWHEPQGELTEDHADRIGTKIVHHEDPEQGYVVLNGIKRRIEDCKYL